jgi:trehalose 2-sulfotransferase
MNSISEIFNNPEVDLKRINGLQAKTEPRCKYIIAITPRSGSSYLCDVMKRVKRFGLPDEMLNKHFIPGIMKKIPGRTPEEYLRNVTCSRKSKNGLSGLKVSWFQFNEFLQAMSDKDYLKDFKFIYLTRRDLAAQAVSLYKATATSVFHTNVKNSEDALRKLETLDYNFAEINYWYEHIVVQERGWQNYFFENRIFPLCLTYEEIEEDIRQVLLRIATYVGVKPENVVMPVEESIFTKVRDIRNLEWAFQFALDRSSQIEVLPPNGFMNQR